jgi:hypothetical protein
LAALLKDNAALLSINVSNNDLGVAGGKAIAEGIHGSRSLTECTLLKNSFDVETATVLAKISKDKQISLCGITAEQTEAEFKDHDLNPADAILIAAALEFRGSLTVADLRYNQLDTESATLLASLAKEKKISLCGITPDQAVADFRPKDWREGPFMKPADAILLTADLAVRGSLTVADLRFNQLDTDSATMLANIAKEKISLSAASPQSRLGPSCREGSTTWNQKWAVQTRSS